MSKIIKKIAYSIFLYTLTAVLPAQGMGSFYSKIANGSLFARSQYNLTSRAIPFVTCNILKNHTAYLIQFTTPIKRRNLIALAGSLACTPGPLTGKTTNIDAEIYQTTLFQKIKNLLWDLNSVPLIPWYLKQFTAFGVVPSLVMASIVLPYGFRKAFHKTKQEENHSLYGKKSDTFYKSIVLASYIGWISKSVIPYIAKQTPYGEYADIKTLFETNKYSRLMKYTRSVAIPVFCLSFLLEICRVTKKYIPARSKRIINTDRFADV